MTLITMPSLVNKQASDLRLQGMMELLLTQKTIHCLSSPLHLVHLNAVALQMLGL
jgi:hypothetical protein